MFHALLYEHTYIQCIVHDGIACVLIHEILYVMVLQTNQYLHVYENSNVNLQLNMCRSIYICHIYIMYNGPTSGNDDICIAVWLESTAHSKR